MTNQDTSSKYVERGVLEKVEREFADAAPRAQIQAIVVAYLTASGLLDELERLREALTEIRRSEGTSTRSWKIANDALSPQDESDA